jgi:hypothetical protein
MLDDTDIEHSATSSKVAEIGTVANRGRSSAVKHTLIGRQHGERLRIIGHLAFHCGIAPLTPPSLR